MRFLAFLMNCIARSRYNPTGVAVQSQSRINPRSLDFSLSFRSRTASGSIPVVYESSERSDGELSSLDFSADKEYDRIHGTKRIPISQVMQIWDAKKGVRYLQKSVIIKHMYDIVFP